ncbi:MAG TPA: CRISPR-associated helicase Cas3', partial [Bryobacteraceae bacterium]
MDYGEFFRGVTGRSPFLFQERLRTATARWLLLRAPTGLGKTDGLLVSWLHRRVTEPARTARRLVWCLPGRALTEQVARVAEERVAKAGLNIRVCRLLGGSKGNDLTLTPDDAAILVGTQDLLLSRALNRGYARNPFRWPIDFALLNNDCEWVLDEVQLLGEGLATSAQLAAFRERFGCFGPVRTSWASATFDAAWLRTVDFAPLADSVTVIGVEEGDLKLDLVRQRVHAQKRVERAPETCRMPRGVAQFVAEKHRAGTISLIICNTVSRAVEIRRELSKRVQTDVQLLHSRFRAEDRKEKTKEALGAIAADGPGRIIIATQVIEAGIDLDASLLITDLAPWPSLVQRFGRANRYGEREGCEIFWVDRPLTGKQQKLANVAELKPKEAESTYAPYGVDEVKRAAEILESLSSAAPADLPEVSGPHVWEHVLRKSDLLDLFDTSSDLGGNQLDISRFVRSGEDTNVYVAWRDWEGEKPPKEPQIGDEELCPVPIGDAKDLKQEARWWNAVTSEWQHPETEPFPGMVLLLHSSKGHYTPELGWSPESKERVEPVPGGVEPMEGLADERKSFASYRQLLEEHTEEVCQELERLLKVLAGMGLEE